MSLKIKGDMKVFLHKEGIINNYLPQHQGGHGGAQDEVIF